MVPAYLTNFNSVVLTQCEFRHYFPRRRVQCARAIKHLAEHLVLTGSTAGVAISGRPRSTRTSENIAAVANDVRENPQASTRQRCTRLAHQWIKLKLKKMQ